jgi:hypothetical protein
MIGVVLLLLLVALVTTIAAAMNRCPLWIPVFVVIVVLLLEKLPR